MRNGESSFISALRLLDSSRRDRRSALGRPSLISYLLSLIPYFLSLITSFPDDETRGTKDWNVGGCALGAGGGDRPAAAAGVCLAAHGDALALGFLRR